MGVAPILYKDVEDNAVLIDDTPEIVLHPLDPDEYFIHVPLVSGLWPAAAHAIGETLAEFLAPAPHCLIGDHDAPLSQEQLDVTQAEAEHVIQPHSMGDELGWEAMAVVRAGWWIHATTFRPSLPGRQSGYRDNALQLHHWHRIICRWWQGAVINAGRHKTLAHKEHDDHGGKVFAIGRQSDDEPSFTFKVSDIAYEMLEGQPGLRPAPYFASRGMKWIQHYARPGLSGAGLRDYIGQSHAIVWQGLSRQLRIELGLVAR